MQDNSKLKLINKKIKDDARSKACASLYVHEIKKMMNRGEWNSESHKKFEEEFDSKWLEFESNLSYEDPNYDDAA